MKKFKLDKEKAGLTINDLKKTGRTKEEKAELDKARKQFGESLSKGALEATKRYAEAIKDPFSEQAKRLAEITRNIKIPVVNLPEPQDYSWVADKIKRDAIKEAEETEIRRLTLEKLRKEQSSVEENPNYNLTSSQITFTNQIIQIPADTDQDALCRILLKDGASMKKVWPMDELQEEVLGTFDSSNWRKVYNAAREINQKVAVKTSITDFLIITTKTIALNPKYLK